MLIAGIDLAAEPKGTAVSVVDWTGGKARLVELQLNTTDADLLEITKPSKMIGIDCAFGWPVDFVKFVNEHASLSEESKDFDGGMISRRKLAYRETDRTTRELTGRWPLSVSTDRLGLTAMRCAGLLGRLNSHGRNTNRSGSGDVVEIYPGATLRLWDFNTTDYRKSPAVREVLLDNLLSKASWLAVGEFRTQLIASCDAFDSLIASLATRAVALGKFSRPNPEQQLLAEIEGWVALPTVGIEELI